MQGNILASNLDFVEGIVEDITIDYSGYGRVESYRYKFVTLRIKISENRHIDIRMRGFLAPITIVRGHKVRALGYWISENVFVAKRIEDLTTGEWWEVKEAKGFLPLIIAIFAFMAIIFVFTTMNPFLIFRYFTIIFFLVLILFVVFFVVAIYNLRGAHGKLY